jgi:hypothetical protein
MPMIIHVFPMTQVYFYQNIQFSNQFSFVLKSKKQKKQLKQIIKFFFYINISAYHPCFTPEGLFSIQTYF